jgi:hypothetical protein
LPEHRNLRIVPGMHGTWLGLLYVIVLAFFGVVFLGCLSWGKMGAKKRIAGVLLMAPHFLLVVCIGVGLLCGQAPQGSSCFNTQFFAGVLMVFILPVPALVGTLAALIMFSLARWGSSRR